MVFSLRDKVWWFALYSRAFVIIWSMVSNIILPDHNAGVFLKPEDPSDDVATFGDYVIEQLFGGLLSWDAQYFIHIASYGYTYENCLAFFPLFPLIVRGLAKLFLCLFNGLLSYYSLIVVSAIIVNLICFMKSSLVLYDLTLKVLKDEALAYKAAILFCVNPASIFFTAPYSESLFTFLSFTGMLKCVNTVGEYEFSLGCGLLFGLSASDRSNGIINIGFIIYDRLRNVINYTIPIVMTKLQNIYANFLFVVPLIVGIILLPLITFFAATLLAIFPFVAFQVYGYYKFCIDQEHNLPDFVIKCGEDNNFRLPGSNITMLEPMHWCKASFPLAYSYVQSHYWNVGFLQYYEWKQIPNFLLALPVIIFILTGSYNFVKQNVYLCLTLGLFNNSGSKYKNTNVRRKKQKYERPIYYHPDMFVYIVHAVFLTVSSTLFIHVQVTTRLIASSTPVLYWFAAYQFTELGSSEQNPTLNIARQLTKINKSATAHEFQVKTNVESMNNLRSTWKVFILTEVPSNTAANLVKYYFLSYLLLGTAMFSNFYPWT